MIFDVHLKFSLEREKIKVNYSIYMRKIVTERIELNPRDRKCYG